MKTLWLLLLLGCSIAAQARVSSSDSALLAGLSPILAEKMQAASDARQAALTSRAIMLRDSLRLAAASPADSATAVAALRISRRAYDSLERESVRRSNESNILEAASVRLMGMNPPLHKTAHGATLGWFLIALICGLSVVVIIILVVAGRRRGFSLKDALSENTQDKLTIPNPEYSASKMKNWLSDFTSKTIAEMDAKVQAAKASLADAQSKLDKDNPTADQQQAVNDATQALKMAESDYQMAQQSKTSGPNAAALVGLSRLFPPTIEVSASSMDFGRVMQCIAARKARLEIEAQAQPDAQQLKAARQAEDAAFIALQEPGPPVYRPSASRLIAFISAMLLFIVGLACACFFLFFYLVNGLPPDLSRLPAILLALGIGMAPYAVNKVATAAKSKDTPA